MRPKTICMICILNRVHGLLSMKGLDEERKLEIMREVLRFLLNEFSFEKSTTVIGTKREELLKRLLGEEDPYKEVKILGNEAAKKAWEAVRDTIPSDYSYESFRKLMIVAAAANAMEWFIAGYEFRAEEFLDLIREAEKSLAVDDTREMYGDFQRAKKILYVLDNAGEAYIDLQVVRYLAGAGKEVIVGARSVPGLNDITYKEAIELGFSEVAKVIPSGPYVGFILDETVPEEFRKAVKEADMIILKGMGNYEGVVDYRLDKPTYALLRVKCPVVAESLGVSKGSFVIKKIYP